MQCTKCHTKAVAFHLYTATSPGYKNCRSCHRMKHDGKKVANSKCASCHKGKGSGPAKVAQHAKSITKKYVCGACHKQKLHARSVSKKVKNCRTCHRGKFHAVQREPGKSTCTKCHAVSPAPRQRLPVHAVSPASHPQHAAQRRQPVAEIRR